MLLLLQMQARHWQGSTPAALLVSTTQSMLTVCIHITRATLQEVRLLAQILVTCL